MLVRADSEQGAEDFFSLLPSGALATGLSLSHVARPPSVTSTTESPSNATLLTRASMLAVASTQLSGLGVYNRKPVSDVEDKHVSPRRNCLRGEPEERAVGAVPPARRTRGRRASAWARPRVRSRRLEPALLDEARWAPSRRALGPRVCGSSVPSIAGAPCARCNRRTSAGIGGGPEILPSRLRVRGHCFFVRASIRGATVVNTR